MKAKSQNREIKKTADIQLVHMYTYLKTIQ